MTDTPDLLDVDFYLAQLPEAERSQAALAP